MSTKELQQIIDAAWERRAEINTGTKGQVLDAVQAALDGLDRGEYRVAEKRDGKWETNQWLKKAVLLSFRLINSTLVTGGGNYPGLGEAGWYDKVPSKFAGWTEAKFREAGFRAVPNCVVRRSAYVAPGAILMPSFLNVGAGSTAAPWWIPGSRSARARRSARTATSPAASASAACWSRCRPARW